MIRRHRMPFGAEVQGDGGVRFRLWAPAAAHVTLECDGARVPMAAEPDGFFAATVAGAGAGSRYRYRLPDGLCVPDPVSRFQPDDVHGASEVIDPAAFAWDDAGWRGRPWHETVLYELHVGTWTPAGTFTAAAARLDALARLGVTAIELMPVAEFPGRRGWGYDGVLPFAPESSYGRPEDLKRLVAAAHARGLMVFLDVVYNHFGPEGNYLARYAPGAFTDRYSTPWGPAVAFEGAAARPMRDLVVQNALYWTQEYHIDGLRLDAVHAIHDASRPHVLAELAAAVQAAAGDRHVHLVLENDANEARWLARDRAGRPRWFVAQWNDDLHHAAHVLATGEREGYYADYASDPLGRLGRALATGFVYQGEPSAHRGGRPRGEPSGHLPPTAFVAFLQNHDQVGNRAFGDRLTTLAPARALRALATVLLLSPQVPMLFMGEEWGTQRPFPFFCDFGPALADAVREGRRREFRAFSAFADAAARARIPDPGAVETFAAAALEPAEASSARARSWMALHRRLLAIRRREIVPRLAGMTGGTGAATRRGASGLEVAWRLGDGARLTLLANLGAAPLVAPRPPGRVLAATPQPAARTARPLAPWSVVWTLEEALEAPQRS